MAKSPDAFRTISEVSDWLGIPAHVLRFWESRFSQLRPVKRAGGRRYYRPADMALLGGIRRLLHDDGITIKGVQKILREKGAKHVSGLCLETIAAAAGLEDAPSEKTGPGKTGLEKTAITTILSAVKKDAADFDDGTDLAAAPQWSVATEARVEQSETNADDDDKLEQERLLTLYRRLLALHDRVSAGMSGQ